MRRLAAVAVLCLLLAGCSASGSPAADLQTRMNAVTDAANAKDGAALRTAVGEFLQTVQQQSANADITTTKAQDLKTVATRLLAEASVLEAASPQPSPSATEPSPSPSPSPSPLPPPPPPSPSPTQAPASPVVVPSVVISASPAAAVSSPPG